MGNLGGDINTGTLPGGEYIPNGGVNTGGTGGTGGTGTGGATGGGFDFNTFLQQWMQSIMPGASPQGQSIENPNQRRKINEIQAKIDDGTYTGYHLKLAQDKIEELRNDPALRQFPSRSINLVDTRTPFMQGLEFLSAPMMAGMLTQPGQTFGQMFGGSQVPGMAGFDQNNPAMAAYKGAPKNPFGDLLGLLGSVGGGSIGINDHSGPGGGTVTPGGGGQLPNPYDPLNPYDPGGGGSMLINQGGGQGGFDPGSTINTGITPPGPGGGTVTPTLPGGGTTGGTGGTGGPTGGGGLPPDSPMQTMPGQEGYQPPITPTTPQAAPAAGTTPSTPFQAPPGYDWDENGALRKIDPNVPDFTGQLALNYNPSEYGGDERGLRMLSEIMSGTHQLDINSSMWGQGFTKDAEGNITDPRAAKGVVNPSDPNNPYAQDNMYGDYRDLTSRYGILGQLIKDPTLAARLPYGFGKFTPEQFSQAYSSLGKTLQNSGYMDQSGNFIQPQGYAEANKGLTGGGAFTYSGTPVTNRATGGLLDPDAINIVGEQGPEAIIGNQVIPNSGIQQYDGGMVNSMLDTEITNPFNQVTGQQGGLQNTSVTGGNSGYTAPNSGLLLDRLLGWNPEVNAYNQGSQILGQNFLNQNPGQGVIDAMEPVFQRNLNYAQRGLANTAPSVSNSAMALQGTDLSRQALQDFNVLGAQSLQQGLDQQLSGLNTLGGLAGQAGTNPMNRALGVGQLGLQGQGQQYQNEQTYMNLAQQQQQFNSLFGLQGQQQDWNQTIKPALDLLMQLLPMLGPTGYQTVAMGG